jgi:hypothetical protein
MEPPPRPLAARPATQDALIRLQSALESSWDHLTAYRGITRPGNPAYGQCYPTSRVVQWFYPAAEIASGTVWTGETLERHFWNVFVDGDRTDWVDLSWQQFPPGASVKDFQLLDRDALGDSPGTLKRCTLLLRRVQRRLG